MIVGHFRNFRLQTMPVSIAFAQGMLSAELAALLHNQPQPSKYSKTSPPPRNCIQIFRQAPLSAQKW